MVLIHPLSNPLCPRDRIPYENFEKTPKASGYDPKAYREWNGKKGKTKYSLFSMFRLSEPVCGRNVRHF